MHISRFRDTQTIEGHKRRKGRERAYSRSTSVNIVWWCSFSSINCASLWLPLPLAHIFMRITHCVWILFTITHTHRKGERRKNIKKLFLFWYGMCAAFCCCRVHDVLLKLTEKDMHFWWSYLPLDFVTQPNQVRQKPNTDDFKNFKKKKKCMNHTTNMRTEKGERERGSAHVCKWMNETCIYSKFRSRLSITLYLCRKYYILCCAVFRTLTISG